MSRCSGDPDASIAGYQGFRRGHAVDLAKNGGTLGEILLAGDWRRGARLQALLLRRARVGGCAGGGDGGRGVQRGVHVARGAQASGLQHLDTPRIARVHDKHTAASLWCRLGSTPGLSRLHQVLHQSYV